MWVLKKSSAAQRRGDKLFATEEFDFTKPEDCSKFGYNYLEWEMA